MDNNSRETLRRVTQNDPSLTELLLVGYNIYEYDESEFYSSKSADYSTLGAAIANNTHLDRLEVTLSNRLALGVSDREFYDGFKSNSSISDVELHCNNRNIAGGTVQEILKVYQKNSNLTDILIENAGLQSGGDRVIVNTLRSCRNLQKVSLNDCNITDEQLLPIVDAIRGHHMLEGLYLYGNDIGNAGCDTIATLLIDPNCNLQTLSLWRNAINNEAATTIANSLTNNTTKLKNLFLHNNPIDQTIQDIFSKVLCNTSNINHTYSSNHALEWLTLVDENEVIGQNLASLLSMNEGANKSHVAMNRNTNKPNIDMEPLFEWA